MGLIGLLRPLISYFCPSAPFRTTTQSAGDLMYACFDREELGAYPKAVNLNGRTRELTSVESKDENKQKCLWESSVKLVGLQSGDTALANWK